MTNRYLIIIAAYFLCWQFAILARVSDNVSALYPAAGVIVFFIHRWGWKYLPATVLAMLVANLPQTPLWEWTAFNYLNLLRQLVVYGGAALLARKYNGLSLPIDSLNSSIRLLALSLISSLLSAVLAIGIFWLYSPSLRPYLNVIFSGFWLGDFNGIVLFLGLASVVITLKQQIKMGAAIASRDSVISLLASSVVVAVLTAILSLNNSLDLYGYLIILPVLIGTIAFGLNFGILASVLANLSAICTYNLLDGQQIPAIQIQLLCAMVICVGMLLGSAIDDQKAAHFDASHDPLTCLINRRSFFFFGKTMLERAKRYQHSLAIIMLDLDHFKRVNDTYGHEQGDQLLCAVAEQCRSITRAGDLSARIGGEEFVLLIEHGDASKAAQIAERLRREIYKINLGENKIAIASASFGVSVFCGGNESLNDLLKSADKALYVAKNNGRNQVVFDTPAPNITN